MDLQKICIINLICFTLKGKKCLIWCPVLDRKTCDGKSILSDPICNTLGQLLAGGIHKSESGRKMCYLKVIVFSEAYT